MSITKGSKNKIFIFLQNIYNNLTESNYYFLYLILDLSKKCTYIYTMKLFLLHNEDIYNCRSSICSNVLFSLNFKYY